MVKCAYVYPHPGQLQVVIKCMYFAVILFYFISNDNQLRKYWKVKQKVITVHFWPKKKKKTMQQQETKISYIKTNNGNFFSLDKER